MRLDHLLSMEKEEAQKSVTTSNPKVSSSSKEIVVLNKVKLSRKQVIKNLPLTTFYLPLAIEKLRGPRKAKLFGERTSRPKSEQEMPNGISARKRSNEDDMGV